MTSDTEGSGKIHVDRCVCFQRTFAEIKEVSQQTGLRTLEELIEPAEFGLSCHTCHPYVRRMLRTGETVFSELLLEEDADEGSSI